MIEVTVETIQVSLVEPHRIVVLKEIGAERYLPIRIGPCEAEAISVGVKGIDVQRPLTHDLIVNVLDALDAELSHVQVTELADDTFYATLAISAAEAEIEVDVRPSDAIAIAVRLGAPIYVAEAVMDDASIVPERDLLAPDHDDEQNLGVFRDYLSSLNLDGSRDEG
jgi:bifunctional DNase/RNase